MCNFFITLSDCEYHYFSVPIVKTQTRPLPSSFSLGRRSIRGERDPMSRCRVIVELLCIRRPTNITDRARHADEAEQEEKEKKSYIFVVAD